MRYVLIFCALIACQGCSNTRFGRWVREDDVEKYFAQNPATPDEIKQAIVDGRVLVGMTWEQVKLSVGDVMRVNRTQTAYGVHEQLIYPSNLYVYLDNNVVTAVQD